MATPKGIVDNTFRSRLRELRQNAIRMHNAFQGKTRRVWEVPSGLTTSLLDVENLHEPAFNRQALNEMYNKVMADPDNPGTVGDTIGLKLQIDYNATEERAFRARHMSICRAFAIGHGRRIGVGHGKLYHPQEGIEATVANYFAQGN